MEYKFRAKNEDSGKWEYGYYVKYIKRQVSPIGDFLDESDVVHLICQSGFADWNMERPLNAVEVIPETVGMFTGLTDIDSKEIYAGDIVEAWSQGEKAKGIVERRMDGLWIMYPAYQKGDFWGLCPNNRGETTVKIIDNIHNDEDV